MIGNVNKVDIFFLVGSLCNNQYNTWLLGDIESLFVCTTSCFARETLSSFLATPMCHSPLIFPLARLRTINQSYLYLSALGSSWQSFYSVVQHKVVVLAAEYLKEKNNHFFIKFFVTTFCQQRVDYFFYSIKFFSLFSKVVFKCVHCTKFSHLTSPLQVCKNNFFQSNIYLRQPFSTMYCY